MTNIHIAVDLGYRDMTTIVIFRPNNKNNKFTFSSLVPQTEFEDVVAHVAALIEKHDIPLENLEAPRQPALEQAIKRRFRRSGAW